jgi:SanA protein
MTRKWIKIFSYGLLLAVVLAVLLLGLPRLLTASFANDRLFTVDSVPQESVAIVFGAGLQRNGMPTAVLRDRIETAVQLYQTNKVDKLLMSGDNRFVDYNEPGAMQDYAIGLGVPAEDIVLDFAGRRTYDTCYRARHIFGVKGAILVSQGYHLPRALFTCNQLGVQSSGVPADQRRYLRRSYAFWNIREVPATSVALWEVWVSRPLPVLGQPEPIFTEIPQVPPDTSLQ